MTGVDPKDFEFALSQIDNGNIFEDFARSYLAQVRGDEFIPAGGIKDRGIDGLEHVFYKSRLERTIYQSSIAKNAEGKLRASLQKLVDNGIQFDQFYFVTNRVFKNQDKLTDDLFEQYKKPIHIRDLKWLSSHANDSQGTINAFHTFVSSYLHEFVEVGRSYVVGDLVDDPRLFVFLRQQWDYNHENEQLDKFIADTLILFALQGTDPDRNLFKSREDIKQIIAQRISFDPRTLHAVIDRRLEILSTKPRRIKHHRKIDAYCLPYETRLENQKRNLEDARLHEAFRTRSAAMLERHLKNVGVSVRDCFSLMESTFNQIYYQQGLEFTQFVLKGENQEAFEKDLMETVSKVVDDSPVVGKNKELVKSALMMTIREIVYNGTAEQKAFLSRLSNTYLMLFLLQCDPKVCTFFSSLAGKLNVYVCTSILIPAMSEYYLAPENRRHWNLLKGAQSSGVTLVVNETIIGELVSHFQMLMNKYDEYYRHDEDVYLSDEIQTLYIDEILIRAYFYAKARGNVHRFHDFIDNFVSPKFENAETELQTWLGEEFGIKFVSDASLGISIDPEEEQKLFDVLKKRKSADPKAKNDARLILTLYAIRDKRNETGASDIFGYRTWWLSKDTLTMNAVNEVFKNKYKVSCYMRPDFLYNYINLAPSPRGVRSAYQSMFPTLLGVNISYHLPTDVIHCVHRSMNEHRSKASSRRAAILRTLAEQLRTNALPRTRACVKHYLDEKLQEVVDEEEATIRR
jgi:hypothetical protein